MKENRRLVIHVSATPPSMDIGAAEIRQWHLDKGWSDIGYHWVLRRDGVLELGRDLDGDGNVVEEVGAHAYGFNRDSLGLCIVGGVDEDGKPDVNFTQAQWRTLSSWVNTLRGRFLGLEVVGHRDLDPGKACPCFDVKSWLGE